MTTTATIPLDKITAHPDNVRRDAVADDEMVESIRSQGVLAEWHRDAHEGSFETCLEQPCHAVKAVR